MDHAGTTPYPKSLIEEYSQDLLTSLLGNPHSASTSSQHTTKRIEDIRVQVLSFFNADPEIFDIVFVSNATAAIKLVAECFRDRPDGFWYRYHRDSHTSLIGLREVATRGHDCFESADMDAWLDGKDELRASFRADGLGLIGYPAQSNLNGHRLPLDWIARIRNQSRRKGEKVFTLLDAAALLSTSTLDLSDPSIAPDFTALSFYKIFGFPDLGALIVRKESGWVLRQKRYFGGGTVDAVSCKGEPWHMKKGSSLHELLEDGTSPFHSIIALKTAVRVQKRLFGSQEQISRQTAYLSHRLYTDLIALRHGNGSTVVEVYKDPTSSYRDSQTQGPIIAFNLRNNRGKRVNLAEVEKLAAIRKIHLRSGGLCNPGGTASYLNLSDEQLKQNYSSGQRCDEESGYNEDSPTGSLRVSLGAASTIHDITALLDLVKEFFVCSASRFRGDLQQSSPLPNFYIEALTVFPIKSCAGWQVPQNIPWTINPEGLAWDREWFLVHQGTHTSLSQKKYPKMALIRPELDLANAMLRVRYHGSLSCSKPSEICVPLHTNPKEYRRYSSSENPPTYRVCGDNIEADIYTSREITNFFTHVLDVPCHLARFPPNGPASSMRHSKPHLLRAQQRRKKQLSPTPPKSPAHRLLLSNESPILVISRSSLNRLNESIKAKSSAGKAASAKVFRANIEIAEDPQMSPGLEQPFIEDSWQYMNITNSRDEVSAPDPAGRETVLNVLGPCRRCQMVCIDQRTGERNEEPFVTLAKTRRIEGQINFGVHTGLASSDGAISTVQVGDRVMGYG